MALYINGTKYVGAYQNGHKVNAYMDGKQIFEYIGYMNKTGTVNPIPWNIANNMGNYGIENSTEFTLFTHPCTPAADSQKYAIQFESFNYVQMPNLSYSQIYRSKDGFTWYKINLAPVTNDFMVVDGDNGTVYNTVPSKYQQMWCCPGSLIKMNTFITYDNSDSPVFMYTSGPWLDAGWERTDNNRQQYDELYRPEFNVIFKYKNIYGTWYFFTGYYTYSSYGENDPTSGWLLTRDASLSKRNNSNNFSAASSDLVTNGIIMPNAK